MDDLSTGVLAPLRDRVLADRSLCLEIREDYVNIYYRGGNLLKLSTGPEGYVAFFDLKYAKGDGGALERVLPKAAVRTGSDVEDWLGQMPALKQAMDIFLGQHPKEEREAQQLILRDNNFGGVSRSTDYYICYIEYANPHGRFDFGRSTGRPTVPSAEEDHHADEQAIRDAICKDLSTLCSES